MGTGLPAPSSALIGLAHLARVLEARFPGVLDEWLTSAADDEFHPEFFGPCDAALSAVAREEAAHWVRIVRLAVIQDLGTPKARLRRK